MRNNLTLTSSLLVASSSFATVSTTLVADTYIVKDGSGATAKFYSVLDVYAKGSHRGDTIGCSVLGLSNHPVIFSTSRASVGGDIFVQGGSAGNDWRPTDDGAKRWDSFIAAGNRGQGSKARVTNRAGSLIDHGGVDSFISGDQLQPVPSNYSDGWFSKEGGNAYITGADSENPFARVSLYNSAWNTTYADLYRGEDVLKAKGVMQTAAASASAATSNRIDPTNGGVQVLAENSALSMLGGASLDFHWMIGRFAIEVTGKSNAEIITMQVQFNMVGKNGIGTTFDTGTTFSGSSIPAYKISQFFAFAVPAPGASMLLGAAGLISRRRRD